MRTIDRRSLLFAAFAAFGSAMLVAEWSLSRAGVLASSRGGVVAVAMFVDLVVVLPIAFILLVLRPAGRPLLQAVPVLGVGALVAGALLAGRPETRPLLRGAGAVIEGLVLVAVGRRLRVGKRELGAETAAADDLLLRMSALRDPLLRAAGLELAVLYYALLGPRVRRDVRPGEFSYTENSGVGGVLLAFGLLLLFEGVPVHFLLAARSAPAAWIHAAADLYALVWLVAAYQAARLRPVRVTPERLLVRTSLLWTADVPRSAIAAVTRIREMPTVRGRPDPRVLRAAFGAPPEVLVTLREPVVARGLLGRRKSVTAVALYVDDGEGLVRALADGTSTSDAQCLPRVP